MTGSYRALASAERSRARCFPTEERSRSFISAENALIGELTRIIGSQRHALSIAGVSRGTWHYRQHPRERALSPVPQAQRAYPSRIDEEAREQIRERILMGWSRQESVDHSFAQAWDAGIMLASRRSWWRIANTLEQELRPVIRSRADRSPVPREAPVVTATGPGQAWSWDITDVPSPWRGVVFKAYKITDIFSRQIVGWRVETREADHLAVDMFAHAIATHGAPSVVHADSGPAMRSNALFTYLDAQNITLSHNRPYVSNDNPFSEAGFRTMKYHPTYPIVFETVEDARAYVAQYVAWYNTAHHHSGIALFTPNQVADGTWTTVWDIRNQALQAYYHQHPERFRTKPTTPKPADIVGINHKQAA